MKRTSRERFEAKFTRGGEDECWPWTASRGIGGDGQLWYGAFKLGPKSIGSHRAAWILYRGPIPEGRCVLHACDNPICVNPNHLFLGTRAKNVEDMDQKGRRTPLKTHCPAGHEYTEETVGWYEGKRFCRICHRNRTRERLGYTGQEEYHPQGVRCKRGHEMTSENTYVRKATERQAQHQQCRKCMQEAAKRSNDVRQKKKRDAHASQKSST